MVKEGEKYRFVEAQSMLALKNENVNNNFFVVSVGDNPKGGNLCG